MPDAITPETPELVQTELTITNVDEFLIHKFGNTNEPLAPVPQELEPETPAVEEPTAHEEPEVPPPAEVTPEPKEKAVPDKNKRREVYEALEKAINEDKSWQNRQKQEGLKAKEAEELTAKFERIRKGLDENPDDALAELGTSFDKLTERKLDSKPKEAWEIELEKERAARIEIETRLARITEEREAQQKAWYEQQLAQAKNQFRQTAAQKYELVSAFDSVDYAEHIIRQELESNGRRLSDDEGLELVEKAILDKLEKALSIPKVQEFVKQRKPEWFAASKPEPKKPIVPPKSSAAVPVGQATPPPKNLSSDELISLIANKARQNQ